MTSKTSLWISSILSIILFTGLLAGCSRSQGTITAITPSATSVSTSETSAPTSTPEPPVVWLVTGPQVSSSMRQEFSSWLAARAEQDGMRFSEMDEFRSSDVPAQLRVAVFLFPGDEISSLAANLPETQFVVVTSSDLPTAANLTVIQTSGNQAAFLAGYLATLNAPDFRSGGLFVDDAAGGLQQESFLNGGRYLCGRCSPVFTPLVPFPQSGLVPAGSSAAGWQSAFETLNQNRIEMLYISGEGLTSDFLGYLVDKNVGILSDVPPPPAFESIWIATVSSNPLAALETLWPEVMAGSSGKTVLAGLEITNVNSSNLSSGRLEMANKLIPDLQTGWITPLTVP